MSEPSFRDASEAQVKNVRLIARNELREKPIARIDTKDFNHGALHEPASGRLMPLGFERCHTGA
jgi:hypothetical protein